MKLARFQLLVWRPGWDWGFGPQSLVGWVPLACSAPFGGGVSVNPIRVGWSHKGAFGRWNSAEAPALFWCSVKLWLSTKNQCETLVGGNQSGSQKLVILVSVCELGPLTQSWGCVRVEEGDSWAAKVGDRKVWRCIWTWDRSLTASTQGFYLCIYFSGLFLSNSFSFYIQFSFWRQCDCPCSFCVDVCVWDHRYLSILWNSFLWMG